MTKTKRKNIYKTHKSIISFILIFALIFSALPSDAFCLTASAEAAESDIIYVVKELEEYRTESSKTFLKSDGTLEAIVSSQPLHYKKDGSSEWLDIEHTLELVDTDEGEVYKNKSGPFSVSFPKSIDENSAVTINDGENEISIEFLDYKKSNGKTKDKVKQKSSKEKRKLMTASELAHEDLTLGASIEYNEVYTDTDVKYDFNSGAVKESIILNKKPNKHAAYRYMIKAEGLTAELNSDGSINFYKQTDTEHSDMIFHLPAPYMYDSNGVYSYDIKTELEKSTGGYILTYTPNTDWLRSKERVYPVVIDPTFYVGNSVKDSYTSSAQPDTYFGYEDQLKIGRETTESGKVYYDTYMHFTGLPEIPEDFMSPDISYLTLYPKAYTGTWEEVTVQNYGITEEWYTHQNDNGDESLRLTYNNAPSDEGFIRDETLLDNDYVSGEAKTLVSTSTGSRWIFAPEEALGIRLSLERSDTEPDACLTFHSSRSTEGMAPYMTINYIKYVPLESIEIVNRPVDDMLELGIFTNLAELFVNFYPEDASNKEVYWEVINESTANVVTIQNNGTSVYVYPVNCGTATIRAYTSYLDVSDSFEITVYQTPMESLSMTRPRYDTLVLGRTFTPEFTITPANATDAEFLLENELQLTSSNESVAVIEERTIRAVGCGTTTITAAIPSCNVSCSYQLKADVQRAEDIFIIGTPDDYHLGVNCTYQLSAVVQPDGAVNKNVTFTSSDDSIATVSSTGLVTGVSPGMVTITAQSSDVSYVSDSFDFKVISTEVTFNKPTDDVLMLGTSWQLATESHIKVDAGNSNIVTVGSNGWITANAVGTVRLEVYNITNRGGFVSYFLTVTPSGMEITGLPSNLNMYDVIQGVGVTITPIVEYDPGEIVWTMTSPILKVTYGYEEGIKVSALAAGTTTLTAYIPTLKASASMVVSVSRVPVTSVTLENYRGLDDCVLYINETGSLIATITPTTSTFCQRAEALECFNSNSRVTFVSPTSHYTRVDVLAKSVGREYVSVKADGVLSNQFSFLVKNPSVVFTSLPTDKTMYTGEEFTLGVETKPANRAVTFTAQPNNIVSISDSGKITALNSGTVTITASFTYCDITYSNSFALTVRTSVSGVTITNKPTNNTLYVGDTHQLSASITPSDAYNKNVTWSSSNNGVATVNSSGKITAVGVGTATITATSAEGGYKAYCVVNVMSADPFHPCNTEYVTYTKLPDPDGDYLACVFKSTMSTDEFFSVSDGTENNTGNFIISDSLINELNSLERAYQEQGIFTPATYEEECAHIAKGYTDDLVSNGYITNHSSEYYGIWAYHYEQILEYGYWLSGVFDTALAAYSVYLTATSFYYSYLSSTSLQSTYVSSSQYNNLTSYIDDIDDAMNGMSFNNKKVISAEERNLSLQGQGYTNPYEVGTPVVKFSQNSTTQYVRVYTSGTTQPVGKWIMKYSDIQGLTPAQIQSKFALPNTPTHYCFVNVPKGTQMYAGIVGENYGYTAGQAVQFELGTNIPTESFGAGIPLP